MPQSIVAFEGNDDFVAKCLSILFASAVDEEQDAVAKVAIDIDIGGDGDNDLIGGQGDDELDGSTGGDYARCGKGSDTVNDVDVAQDDCELDLTTPVGVCNGTMPSLPESDPACEDGFAYTIDQCTDEGCTSTPDSFRCADRDACTTEACVAGTGCVITPIMGCE